MSTRQNIVRLRSLMKQYRLEAYIVPSADPHASEYVPDIWKRRAFITGFTGSAGDAIITRSSGALWTDSRYFVQAGIELRGSGIRLMKLGEAGTPGFAEWLGKTLKRGARVGYDPQVISQKQFDTLSPQFAGQKLELAAVKRNLADMIWDNRPLPSRDSIQVHPIAYAGEAVSSKLRRLRKEMKTAGATVHVIAALDMIAWLFNIRGRDIPYNPLAISYALVTQTRACLFTDPRKATPELRRALGKQVQLRRYDGFASAIKRISRRSVIWIDPASTSRWIVDIIPAAVSKYYATSPIMLMRARKNKIEIHGSAKAHVRDGVALCRFLHWLETHIGNKTIDEVSAAQALASFRARSRLYRGDSFDPIVGYGEHAAIIHYSAKPESCFRLRRSGILLLDTGGQYLDGTTDITRTICLGRPTAEQKDRFTRVLKGHIAIASCSFPAGTSGASLDGFARRALWEQGLNYGHGTGHGVGSYLCVHEGPHRISPLAVDTPFEEGMIVSNEPGYYEAGRFGFRIENLVYCTADKERSTRAQMFYRFENLTMCPIDTRLVDKRLLTAEEIRYLNTYHATVRRKLLPFLKGSEATWLKRATRAI